MRYAELFAGYGGLSLAVEHVWPNAELAWYSEFEDAPSKVMGRHWPGVPNHGDATNIPWLDVEPVDLISGGSPCQDVSSAGRHAGMTDGTRSNLWIAMRDAITAIKPQYVIWENVRGAHSARAYSDVESEPGRVAKADQPALRATGRVVGDLAGLGYDAEWRTIPASSVGAPHRRERVFVLAWRRDSGGRPGTVEDSVSGRDGGRHGAPGQGERTWPTGPTRGSTGAPSSTRPTNTLTLLPTVTGSDGNGAGRHGEGAADLRTTVTLLPTPQANLGSNGGSQPPEKRRAGGHSVSVEDVVEKGDFGPYAPAIQRWESVLGRPAPPPTELSPKGRHRLSEHFTEFIMGLPEGWVTGTEGVTRREAIKMCGNGVVPLQAATAIADMLQHQPPGGNTARLQEAA